jgi:arsenate reductase
LVEFSNYSLQELFMSSIKIYHNPKCSKSREALELLRSNGVEPVVIEYLKNPPSEEELDDLLANKLKMSPDEIMRVKEDRYRELGLPRSDLSRDELIKIISENPILIERPIVVNEERAVIGRPTEKVLEIL